MWDTGHCFKTKDFTLFPYSDCLLESESESPLFWSPSPTSSTSSSVSSTSSYFTFPPSDSILSQIQSNEDEIYPWEGLRDASNETSDGDFEILRQDDQLSFIIKEGTSSKRSGIDSEEEDDKEMDFKCLWIDCKSAYDNQVRIDFVIWF